MGNQLLDDYLKRLRLPTVARNYATVSKEAIGQKVTYEDYLCSLMEQEVQAREENCRKDRLHRAKFPAPKTLDGFYFEEVPSLDKKLLLQLSKGKYLQSNENIVFIGPHGVGKTHLAIALAVEACAQGKCPKFFTVGQLITMLIEAQDEKQLLRLQQQLSKYDPLILDELGMVDCKPDEANLLFQVISSRYERRSTIITTNLEFKDWTSVFCTQQLTAAVLDRLIHRCHIVQIKGESYRFKESVRRKKGKETAA